MTLMITTHGLGPNEYEGSRIVARAESGTTSTEPLYVSGEELNVRVAHERTARNLARLIFDERDFRIEHVREEGDEHTFRVSLL